MKKICHCKKSRLSLFILSKREDDLVVMHNVQFKFRQVWDIIACSEDILRSLLHLGK